MNMRARLGVAVFAGFLLGLLIIGSAAYLPYRQPGTAPYQVHFDVFPSSIATSTVTSSTPGGSNSGSTGTSTAGNENSSSSGESYGPPLASQIDSIGRQPLGQSVVALLPVLAAVFFGMILYRVSAAKSDEEPPRVR